MIATGTKGRGRSKTSPSLVDLCLACPRDRISRVGLMCAAEWGGKVLFVRIVAKTAGPVGGREGFDGSWHGWILTLDCFCFWIACGLK